MDPSTAGGGQQQQRNQQPVYDVGQGGHYGKSSIHSPALAVPRLANTWQAYCPSKPIIAFLNA